MQHPARRTATQIGDVWSLGKHRLVCGDATDPATVALALDGAVPHLMVTDPPYGVGYDPAWRIAHAKSVGTASRSFAIGAVMNDGIADWRAAWDLFPGSAAYVWHGALQSVHVLQSLEASKFEPRAQIIWDKKRPIFSRGHFHWQHEPCWYVVRKRRPAHWQGDRRQRTIWPIPHVRSQSGHATEKPLLAMQRPIENNSARGDAVYDPFVGSGTTIVAAEITGRVCHAIELNPAYVDIAIARWETLTGLPAVRLGAA
ncbi:DNA-methyltransferase [Lichenihabitans psoromatis]|uniref:DNA-methyltransferase n=1 Tax=Lichenihabitans psoromatis TaxID=2528642 RepID=UPI001036BFFC|nr:site-specific DNA-methyltransferase [Lichenihabitans psoromatis]